MQRSVPLKSHINLVVTFPCLCLTALIELLVCRRGLALGFLLLAAVLTTAGWIQPPLSSDIRGLYVPLGIFEAQPINILRGPRSVPADSAGIFLLALVGVGVLAVLWRPQNLGWVSGLLLCGTLAGLGAATINHPVLVELMEKESTEREQIASMLSQIKDNSVVVLAFMKEEDTSSLSRRGNARSQSSNIESERGLDLVKGETFLTHGVWLIPLTALGIVFSTAGTLCLRVRNLAIWSLVGIVLTSVVCGRRVYAEYYWCLAERAEIGGDWDKSRMMVDRAVKVFPQLDQLDRTWLLRGRLDYRQARLTPHRRFYQASQLVATQPRQAFFLLESLAQEKQAPSNIRQAAADILVHQGFTQFFDGQLTSARDNWHRAVMIDGRRLDCWFYIAIAHLQADPRSPEVVEAEFARLLSGSADRLLRADVLAWLGDAYFGDGQFTKGRDYYRQSQQAFHLPKQINFRSLKGLGGI